MAQFACSCGAFRAEIEPDGARGGTHAICHCTYCRDHAERLGHPEAVGEAGGVRLYQSMPSRVRVTQGAEHLASMKLSARGPLRWYAACCGSPVAVTGPVRGIPMATLYASGLPEGALGPLMFRVNTGSATGPVPDDTPRFGLARGVARFSRWMAAERLTGRYKRTPFFDDAGNPVAEPSRP